MKRGEILDRAKGLVTEAREVEHGDPNKVYSDVARLWEAYTGCDFNAGDVYMMLVMMKMCRLRTNPDNWVDIAGYAALAGEFYGANGVCPLEPS